MLNTTKNRAECSGWSMGFAEMPMEIILYIFRFLGHSDLQVAGKTCARWREATYDPCFTDKTLVRFSKVCLSDRMSPAQNFLKCDRPFRNYYLEQTTFGPAQETLARIGKFAIEITFDNVDLGEKQFYAIMRQLPNLRALTITRCSPLFMSGSFLENREDRMMLDLCFSNIRHLSLRHNQYLSDAILLRLTQLIRKIYSLDLSSCHIAYHNAIQRRFYPNDSSVSPSESILTFKFIMHILITHRQHLRDLNLSNTLIGAPSLFALCELDHVPVSLHRLRLANCRQLNSVALKTFLRMQMELILLDLSDTSCVDDDCLDVIVTNIPGIKELSIAGCTIISNNGAALLRGLKQLKRLDISRCDGIRSEGIINGVAATQNQKLVELHMAHLQVCEECIKAIATNLSALRVLNLGYCINGVTDEALQSIIQHLRWLRELSLENCFRITDTAITGINVTKLALTPSSSSSLDNFHPISVSTLAECESINDSVRSMKFSMRTKTEAEIVSDAKKKKAMFAAYELNLIDDCDIEGYNIKQLRGLQRLTLKGCNKITDVSLKYGIKFLELRHLSLSNCQDISLAGIEPLVRQCPSIEDLDLSDCDNINDKSILAVTSYLTRLRALHISGCSQLTDHSVDAILINCKYLQTLSIYRCRRIYTDIEDRLAEMSTLRNLNMDNATNMDNAEIFRLRNRLDY